MPTSVKNIFGFLLVCFLLSGCLFNISSVRYVNSGADSPLQLVPEGATALSYATSRIDNLHMVVVESKQIPPGPGYALAGVPMIWGPGYAWFEGDLLVLFHDDAIAAGLQGGFGRGVARLVNSRNEGDFGNYVVVDQINARYVSWGSYEFQLMQGVGLLRPRAIDYALGRLTPVVALPSTGLVYYDAILRTTGEPTGRRALATTPATLAVQWGSVTTKIGVSIATQHARILTSGGLDENTIGNSEVALVPGTATFSGTNIPTTCVIGCRSSIKGFFAGPQAENAGLTFLVADQVDALNVLDTGSIGLAVRSGQPSASPPPSSGGGGSAFTASLDTSSPPLAMVSAGPSTFTDTTVGISPVTQDSSTGLVTAYTPAETVTINTAQGADMGGDALITWGRWVNGTSRSSGSGGGAYDLDTIGAEQGFHYVIGKPSPSLPASGTANFTLLGATKPTFGDGALPAGTLTSAAMAVEWGGAATRVGVDMTLTMPSDGTYRVMTTGGTTTPGTSEISTTFGDARFQGSGIPVTTTGGARACAGGTCAAKVEGLFTGTNGARAGLVYTVNNGIFFGQPTSVVGAAAFIKQ